MPGALTERRAAFVAAMAGPADFTATRAARIAGFAWPRKAGPRLMTVAAVAEPVEAAFREQLAAVSREIRDRPYRRRKRRAL